MIRPAFINVALSPYATVPLILFALQLSGCDRAVPSAPPSIRHVKTLTVTQPVVSQSVKWTGLINHADETSLSFHDTGRITTLRVRPGDKVHQGEVIATLAAVQSKQQSILAEAEFQHAVAAETKAAQQLERVNKLITIGVGSLSQREEAKAALAEAQAEKSRTTARRDFLLNRSEDNLLKVPADGTITAQQAISGQLVNAGEAVVSFTNEQKSQMTLHLPLSSARHLHVGDRMQAALEDGSALNGKILYISPSLEETTQLVAIGVELERNLPTGMLVTGSFQADDRRVITIPASSLLRNKNRTAVYIVGPDSRIAVRNITVASFEGAAVAVSAGLNPQDKVVIAGVNSLDRGMKVVVEQRDTQ